MIRDHYLDISKITDKKKLFRLFRAVEAHGGIIRFVGGCVRDALMNRKGFDIDLATDLSPDELVEACEEKGLRTIPIGIKFGTVGVIIDDNVVEVTSLRKDIKTDGRHADVEFTTDWEVDASRRDLTINAVYADLEGNVFDYYNGIDDLEKGIVRFIGSPNQRIKEDYLRILRFFRFYSLFAKTPIDDKALEACIKNKDGINRLSVERITDELKKILLTPKVVETLHIMFQHDILGKLLPESSNLDSLQYLISMTDGLDIPNKIIRRLFVLYTPDQTLAENLGLRLRLTKKQKDMFINLASVNISLEELLDRQNLIKLAYHFGKEFCFDKLLVTLAINKTSLPDIETWLTYIEDIIIPVFPIRGKDLIDLGITDSKTIGKTLDQLESHWLNQNFDPTREELLSTIK